MYCILIIEGKGGERVVYRKHQTMFSQSRKLNIGPLLKLTINQNNTQEL